eukprot:scaffold4317_cov323-Prasinococcus_capsulatus_cf.AAC.3
MARAARSSTSCGSSSCWATRYCCRTWTWSPCRTPSPPRASSTATRTLRASPTAGRGSSFVLARDGGPRFDAGTAYGKIEGIDDPKMGWSRYAQKFELFALNSGLFYLRSTPSALALVDAINEHLKKNKVSP